MRISLDDKVLVIVGGTAGLGLSAAQACLDAGARGVVVVGRDAESARTAEAKLGTRAHALCGEAQDSSTAVAAIHAAVSTFGTFDGLYHVAGGSGRAFGDGPLHELTDVGLTMTLQLNLSSLIFSNRAAIQWWRKAGRGGVILNMGSVLGWSPSPRYFATHAYAAAKSAAIGFTRSVASYYAKDSIRVNVLAPALVETPMARRAASDEAIRHYVKAKQPLDGGRVGIPQDADGACVFLLSDAARFITGQVLSVDGGWTVSEGSYAFTDSPHVHSFPTSQTRR